MSNLIKCGLYTRKDHCSSPSIILNERCGWIGIPNADTLYYDKKHKSYQKTNAFD